MYGMSHGHLTVEDEKSWWFQSAGAAAAASSLCILTLELCTEPGIQIGQIGSFSLPRTMETFYSPDVNA